MKKLMLKTIHFLGLLGIISIGLFTTIGSGDGSSNSGFVDNTTYQLSDANSLTPGYYKRAELFGETSTGIEIDGLMTITALDETSIDDQSVIPVEVYVNLSIEGETVEDTELTYYKSDGTPVSKESGLSIWIPIEVNLYPDTGVIGDSGLLTEWENDLGETAEGIWELRTGGSVGIAEMVSEMTLRNSLGEMQFIQTSTLTINSDGIPLHIAYYLEYDNGATASFQGDVN